MADRPVDHVAVWINFFKKAFNEGDYSVIGVAVAVAVVLLTLCKIFII